MPKLKRVKVDIQGDELLVTPKQLFMRLRHLSVWDMKDFLDNNSTDLFNDFKHKDKIIEEIENIHDQAESDRNERRLNTMELNRQDERSSENLDQPTYPHGWYQKQDNEVIYGKEVKQ